MERRNVDEMLSAPADFVRSDARNKQEPEAARSNLIPPSHFTSCFPPSTTVAMPGPAVGRGSPVTWVTSRQPSPLGMENDNPWLAIAQAKQEILELRKTNQRLMELRGNSSSVWTGGPHQEVPSRMSSADRGDLPPNCWGDTNLKLENERMRTEVEQLKEEIGRQSEDIQKRDRSLNRKSEELEELRAELCQTKTDLGDTRAELGKSRAEQEQLGVELEKLKNMEAERNRLEAQRTETELCRKKTFEESCKLEIVELKEELGQIQRKHQTEV